MDAADPLCAISSPARLLPLTLGGPAPASATGLVPSKARDTLLEAIVVARSLGSEELLKQATMVLKENGDIQALYRDVVKARPPANGSKEPQGRRPALNRKRARFVMKDAASDPVPVVDQSKLTNISDPVEFFMTLERLEEADEEIKRLNGQAEKRVLNFDPVDEQKRQNHRRKSVHSFKVIEDVDAQDPVEVPASQTATMTRAQFSQDDTHAVTDKNEQCVPSNSCEAVSAVSGKEDSLAKDGHDGLSQFLTSFQGLDESEEEEFILKTIGVREIRKERVSLRNSILGVRSLRTEQNGSMRICPPESDFPQTRQDRISELEKHLFHGGAANTKCTDDDDDDDDDDESEGSPDIVIGEPSLVHDSAEGAANTKCTDDESEGSPDIVIGEPSLVHDSAEVLMTHENFTGSEIDRETANLGARAAEHFLDPETNLPGHANEKHPGGPSLGLERDTEVAKENEACSRSNISVEEDDVPIGYPTIGRSTYETEVSSPHRVEGSSTEELVSKPGSHEASDDIDRTSHAAEDSIQHLEVVKEAGVLEGNSSQLLEMPLEDIDPLSQPQKHCGSTKKSTPDPCNALSPTKQKKQQAAQEGKRKSKRGKKVSDESALEIPQANFDSENQPHNDDVNIEQQTVMSSTLSPNGTKGQEGAQRRNGTKRKILADANLGVRRSSRTRSRPLEFWRGERLLYGPINDTLPAVIGIKAYSPGQDGKRTLKVKSFVPEQYKDLVAKSAKY